MGDDFSDLLTKFDEFEPSAGGAVGTREFAKASIDATLALAHRLQAIEEKLDRNNQLLVNMIKVLDSRGGGT